VVDGAASKATAARLYGELLVPPSVAVCHHGSYVGSRERIAAKLKSTPHRDEHPDDWMERVWEKFTPEMTNFHPAVPERWPCAVHVQTEDLPPAIKNANWPEGWIERATATPGAVAG